MKRLGLGLILVLLGACARSDTPIDPGLEGLALERVAPDTVIPGSTLAIEGDSFVQSEWGTSRLRLRGTASGAAVDVTLSVEFVDYDHMTAAVTADVVAALGGDVDFTGDAIMEVESTEDGELYASAPLPVTLQVRRALTPSTSKVQTGGLLFVNDEIAVEGDGFLLGGGEGSTIAIVEGCFRRGGAGECAAITPVEVPLAPEMPFSRTRASFRFTPAIAGIEPGEFAGTVRLENRPAEGAPTGSDPSDIGYELVTSEIFQISPTAASLGQYVFVEGGGFVGGELGASTLIRLVGQFTPTGQGAVDVDLVLVPEIVTGRKARYVLSEDDALGQAIDLRAVTGSFSGTATPIVKYQGVEVTGEPRPVSLAVAPVKQVVFLDYRPTYVESLRQFGLRAVDARIRARVLEVVRAAYPAVNIEFRDTPVEDFALYEHVELHGPDPNAMGLFGYDNSPGKDTGNTRLYDRLGGVNAETQEDGFPGYGGVFIESLMSFSLHPRTGASLAGADPVFDAIFDPVRPDRGTPVTGADLAGALPVVDGASCPATERGARIACAIRTIGSLIGTTLAHEIGHSLGLANPYGDGFHDQGDQPNRLMDGGAERPFLERAELEGAGPAVFCDEEYAYLRQILPSAEPADLSPRPVCF